MAGGAAVPPQPASFAGDPGPGPSVALSWTDGAAVGKCNGLTVLDSAGGLTVAGAVTGGTGLASITTGGDLSVSTGSVAGSR